MFKANTQPNTCVKSSWRHWFARLAKTLGRQAWRTRSVHGRLERVFAGLEKQWRTFKSLHNQAMAMAMLCMLSACASSTITHSTTNGYTDDLPSNPETQKNKIRLLSVSQAAKEYGAQGGLAWRSMNINKATNSKHDVLDNIFRFGELMLPNNLVPPVLTQSTDSVQLDNPETIRLADHTYRILQAAHFTTATISWRDYLAMHYPKPTKPDLSLRPKSRQEVTVWNDAIAKGWTEGMKQADIIYETNLAHLKQDFVGMSLYHTLLAQHIVTPPYVATTHLGITGNAEQLRINDQVLRIAATSQLNPHANMWNPGLSPALSLNKHTRQHTP